MNTGPLATLFLPQNAFLRVITPCKCMSPPGGSQILTPGIPALPSKECNGYVSQLSFAPASKLSPSTPTQLPTCSRPTDCSNPTSLWYPWPKHRTESTKTVCGTAQPIYSPQSSLYAVATTSTGLTLLHNHLWTCMEQICMRTPHRES